MARIPYAETDETADTAALVARIAAQRGGRLPHLFSMLLHNPAIAAGWFDFMTAVRRAGGLDDRTREIVILHVAALMKAGYPVNDHRPIALRAGLTPSEVETLIERKELSAFSDRDRAILDYVAAMTASVQIPDDVFAAARRHLDDPELVELTVLTGAYNMVGRFLEALDVDLEDV